MPERKHFKRTFLIPCKYFLWQCAMCGIVCVVFVLNIMLEAIWRCVLVLHKSSWGYTSIPYQCVYTSHPPCVCWLVCGWVAVTVCAVYMCVCLVSAGIETIFSLILIYKHTDITYTTHHISICKARYKEKPDKGDWVSICLRMAKQRYWVSLILWINKLTFYTQVSSCCCYYSVRTLCVYICVEASKTHLK